MIKEYPTLRHLIKCQYPVLLLDEYQDTQDIVIETLSRLIKADSQTTFGKIDFRVGLFGDSMQSIYDSGAGYVDHQRLDAITITNEDNYRSTPNIVRLINKVRAKSKKATYVEQQVQRTDLPQRSICSLFYTTNDIAVKLRSLDAIASHFNWSLGEDTKSLNLHILQFQELQIGITFKKPILIAEEMASTGCAWVTTPTHPHFHS